jgi:hypothetical protein
MENFIIYVVLMKIEISQQQKLKSRDSSIQLKPILDISCAVSVSPAALSTV